MNSAAIKSEHATSPPLGRADWLQSAIALLVDEGVNAVQITRLAKQVAVTRGSFYWHFKDRNDLLESLLAEWRAVNSACFDAILSDCDTLDQSILDFFECWTNNALFNAQLEQAVRDWARLDPKVLDHVRKEDAERLSILTRVFTKFDYEEDEANVRARVLYFSQMGYTAINMGEAMSERISLLESYYHTYTNRTLDPAIAKRFIQKMEPKK